MTPKDEALRQALAALHVRISGAGRATEAEYKAAMACRAALAQKDEQEPVAEITADDMGRPFNAIRIGAHFYKEIPPVGTKLYTAPPKRQPLTDEQRYALIKEHLGLDKRRDETVIDHRTGRWTDAARYFDLMDAAIETANGTGEQT